MSRHERRRAEREARKAPHNAFYNNYVRHLPQVPIDAPLERGQVYHLVMAHDDWCAIYSKPNGTALDCNCNPVVTRHVQPRRQ